MELLIEKNKKLINLKNIKEIDIDHSGKAHKEQCKRISSSVPKELGLYVYTSAQDNKVLYVGEGILQNRLWRHINKTKPGHNQKDERNIFFHLLKIQMKVFYVEASVLNFSKKKIGQLESAYKLLLNPLYDQMVEANILKENCKIDLNEWEN